MVKSIEVCDVPVRAAKFIPSKQWYLCLYFFDLALRMWFVTGLLRSRFKVFNVGNAVASADLTSQRECLFRIVCGSDDYHIRVYNYNTNERIAMFEAHGDYIRSLAVHPTLPLLLSSSDDMLIKLWDWEKGKHAIRTRAPCTHHAEEQAPCVSVVCICFLEVSRCRSPRDWRIATCVESRPPSRSRLLACRLGYVAITPYIPIISLLGWELANVFEGHSHYVMQVEFSPKDPNTFASASLDRTIKVTNCNAKRNGTEPQRAVRCSQRPSDERRVRRARRNAS